VSFDLRKNSFFVLGMSPRDNGEVLADKIEMLLSDEKLSDELASKLQAELSGSKSRLLCEVSWLMEVSPSHAAQLSKQYFDPKDSCLKQLQDVLEEVGRLSSANLAAHFCALKVAKPDIFQALISSWSDLTVDYVRKSINENRLVSAYPEVSDGLVKEALESLKQLHAEAALECLKSYEHAGSSFSKIVEKYLGSQRHSNPLFESVVEKYELFVIPKLKVYEEEISTVFAEIKKSEPTKLKELVEKVIELLKNWDEYSQPLQLVHQSKGLDEPRAKRLLQEVRDISIWLANEKSEYNLSLEFTKALTVIFPELPSSIDRLNTDIETLTHLVEDAKAHEELSPITKMLEEIITDATRFNKSILQGEFSANSGGIAGAFYNSVKVVIAQARGKPHEEQVWDLLRQIALFLNNKHNWSNSALMFGKGLMDFNPPDAVAAQITADMRIFEDNILGQNFSAAVKAKRIAKARDIAKQILDSTADEEERKEWTNIYLSLVERRKSQVNGWIGWGVVIGFLILIGSCSEKKKNSPSLSQQSYQPKKFQLSTDTSKPAIGTKVLSLLELRWCNFEGVRIDFIFDHLPKEEHDQDPIRRFNLEVMSQEMAEQLDSRIQDYNSRCTNVQYYESDMQRVKLDAQAVRGALVKDAKQTMQSLSRKFKFRE
jgi:hypothetical protein